MFNLPNKISGNLITLELYESNHSEDLKNIAINPKIWEFLPRKINSEIDFDDYIVWLNERINKKILFVYSVFDNATHKIIGSTGFLNYDEINNRIEIGGTWLVPSFWGTPVNTEMKLLLLDLAFSEMAMARVEFRTRDSNTRSQKALLKLGAKHEGIFRWDRINDDGSYRDTYIYSIIRPEWNLLKVSLLKKLL